MLQRLLDALVDGGAEVVRDRAAEDLVLELVLAAALLPVVHGQLALTAKSFGVLVFLGLIQIALAYTLFVKGLKYVTATQASLTGMLEPIANPIWVLLILGEHPSSYAVAGAVVVLAAIAWHTMAGEPATELPAPD